MTISERRVGPPSSLGETLPLRNPVRKSDRRFVVLIATVCLLVWTAISARAGDNGNTQSFYNSGFH